MTDSDLTSQSLTEESALRLLEAARQAARASYSPYSDFPVGAALLLKDGRMVGGTNVENGSYGLTLCAERVAIVKAVSEGAREFLAMAVWGEKTENGAIVPCGACLQVMSEFLGSKAPVVMSEAGSGRVIQLEMAHLLPHGFSFCRTGSN